MPRSTGNSVEHHEPLGKCTSTPQWSITTHPAQFLGALALFFILALLIVVAFKFSTAV